MGDRDKSHRRRLQDAPPLEAPYGEDVKAESGSFARESSKKSNGVNEKILSSSNPAQAPRSRSAYQVLVSKLSIHPLFISGLPLVGGLH